MTDESAVYRTAEHKPQYFKLLPPHGSTVSIIRVENIRA